MSGKLEGWEVWKWGIQLKNVRKIGKMKDDNRNKRGNIAGRGGRVKSKNPRGYTME